MYGLAKKLETHDHILTVFRKHLSRKNIWPTKDVHSDDFMKGYDQDLSSETVETKVKKSRVDYSQTAYEKVMQSIGADS